jgi:hypothetical protein
MADMVTLHDAWKVFALHLAQNRKNIASYDAGLLTLLLSQANKNANNARFQLQPITQAFGRGETQYQATMIVSPRTSYTRHSGKKMEYCGTKGASKPLKTAPVKLMFTTASEVEFYENGFFANIQKGDMARTEKLQEQIRSTIQLLANEVAAYVADPANKLIGAYVGSNGAVTPLQLPLMTTGAAWQQSINPAGETLLRTVARKHETDFILVGGDRLSAYNSVKGMMELNDAGVNAQRVDVIKSTAQDNRVTDELNTKLGTTTGVLGVGLGALQFVSHVSHVGANAIKNVNGQTRYTITEPMYGLEFDVLEEVFTCDKTVGTNLTLSINWTVFGYPCWSEDAEFQGVTDVIAIDITESNATIFQTVPNAPVQTIGAPNAYAPDAYTTATDCITVNKCNAAFTAVQKIGAQILTKSAAFAATDKITQFVCGAANISLLLPSNGNSGFMVGSMLELAAAQTAINAGLVAVGVDAEVMHLAYDGTNLKVFMFAGVGITTANVVVGAGGMNIDDAFVTDPVLVTALSRPSTGAILTDCSYPTHSITGAPNAILDPSVIAGAGINSRFYIKPNSIGTSIDHTITDSANCTDTVTNTVV